MTNNWTTANIPDLQGKIIIVTGANSGIGFDTAKEFARKGAQTILACRDMDKAREALDTIKAEIPGATVEIMELDLASLKSIKSFANAFKEKFNHLDILVNNAGIMMVPYGKTEDGFERQFGTNHLGHFALTGLLMETLKNSSAARVVNISSNGHRFGEMDFGNLLFEDGKDYTPTRAYGRSKLANLLFTYELQHRCEQAGLNIIATAAHPGISNTNLADHLYDNWFLKPIASLVMRIFQSSAMGALPSIRAAVDPNAKGGDYYGPDGPRESKGFPILVQSNEASHNLDDARRLWQVSEELTGVKYLS